MRTNRAKDPGLLEVKSRLVIPGDVDPEDCGFRTDAPTAPQIVIYVAFQFGAKYGWKIHAFDVGNAYLSGDKQTGDFYVRPPPEGLAGVEPLGLVNIVMVSTGSSTGSRRPRGFGISSRSGNWMSLAPRSSRRPRASSWSATSTTTRRV